MAGFNFATMGVPRLMTQPWPTGFQPAPNPAVLPSPTPTAEEMAALAFAPPQAPPPATAPGGVPRFPRLNALGDRMGAFAEQFAERRPRAAAFINNNKDMLRNVGVALMTTRPGEGAPVREAFYHGSQQDQARREREEAEAQQQQSAEMWAGMLDNGTFEPQEAEALRTLLASPNPQDQQIAQSIVAQRLFAEPAGADPTDDMREYEFARGQGYAGTFEDWQHWQAGGAGGTDDIAEFEYAVQNGFTGTFPEWQMMRPPSTVINNNQGPDGVDYGPPPNNHVWQRDSETREIVLDDRGAPVAIPVGPALADQTAAAEATERRDNTQDRQAGVIVANIDTALELANQPMTTGMDGALAANVPGTPAYDLRATVDTIKANIGFASLQEMRNNSPTGGALGQIAVQEITYLQAVWGNLDPNQSHDAFVRQLNDARRITQDIVEGRATVDENGQLVPRQQEVPDPVAPPVAGPAAPAIGAVEDGYRFIGGDPGNPNNWQRVP